MKQSDTRTSKIKNNTRADEHVKQPHIVYGVVKGYKVEKQFGNFTKLNNHLAFDLISLFLPTKEVKPDVDKRLVQYCS